MSEEDRSRVVVRMPRINEDDTEACAIFLKRVGDTVRRDEPIVELDIGKLSVELLAPEDGVIESFAVAQGAMVRIDEPMYVLRTARSALPAFVSATLRWDAGHVQARASGLAEPPVAEAALILTALARSLAAVPGLLLPREPAVATTWVEVDLDAVRVVCASLPIDVEVPAALTLARASVPAEPPDWRAQLRVVRLLRGAASTGQMPGHPLQVVIGPVRDEAVVVAGAIVVRPMATICVTTPVGDEALLRFVAVLAEQLASV